MAIQASSLATVVITRAYQRRLPRKKPQFVNFSPPPLDLTFEEYLAYIDRQSTSPSILTTFTDNYHNTTTTSFTLKTDIIMNNTSSSLLNSTTLSDVQNITMNHYTNKSSIRRHLDSIILFIQQQESYIWKYILYFTFICVLIIVLRTLIRHLSACYRTFRIERYHKQIQDNCKSLKYLTVPIDIGIDKNNNKPENDNSYLAFTSNQISLAGSITAFLRD
ncbi:unnamed protein product [Adineta steineri]|uniref:Uncharacterized protein n=1 Tax=Adineta steineri TaxID=433720 RepID=A0A815B0K2_9BILA|nr:unnamed protein product [Adineta steineri]CAF3586688.1 unnamed protein product [Adineta steineri]